MPHRTRHLGSDQSAKLLRLSFFFSILGKRSPLQLFKSKFDLGCTAHMDFFMESADLRYTHELNSN